MTQTPRTSSPGKHSPRCQNLCRMSSLMPVSLSLRASPVITRTCRMTRANSFFFAIKYEPPSQFFEIKLIIVSVIEFRTGEHKYWKPIRFSQTRQLAQGSFDFIGEANPRKFNYDEVDAAYIDLCHSFQNRTYVGPDHDISSFAEPCGALFPMQRIGIDKKDRLSHSDPPSSVSSPELLGIVSGTRLGSGTLQRIM